MAVIASTSCSPETCKRFRDPVSEELNYRETASDIRNLGHDLGLVELDSQQQTGTAEIAFDTADKLDEAAGGVHEVSPCPGPTEFKVGKHVVARSCHNSIVTGLLIATRIRKD